MNKPKAVIFTHLCSLQYTPNLLTPAIYNREKLKYMEVLSQYLQCNREEEIISIVYVYVDYGIKRAPLSEWAKNASVNVPGKLIEEDNVLLGLLAEAENDARNNLRVANDAPPKFYYVGISRLIALLNELVAIDPLLVDHLAFYDAGNQAYRFTYDSPKFVEAIIRLARGSTAHLAWHPIIRLDEDVKPYPASIRRLLDTYSELVKDSPFFFFSGTYGSEDEDPINDHAVRVHWLSDPNPANPGFFVPNAKVIRHFIADLNELGATQIENSENYYSANLRSILSNPNRPKSQPPRNSPQVISGAGLVMSFRAIDLLPPFLNIGDFVVWVDDHLKRRVHEALRDLGVDDKECIVGSKFKQDRHPSGITVDDITWAKNFYFDRLLRGCIFRRLITNLDGSPTEYSSLLADIVRYRAASSNLWANRTRTAVASDMIEQAKERYDEVLSCWKSYEFQGYASYDWANLKINNQNHKINTCINVVENALRYIDLVLAWPIFIRAIKRLPFVGHAWLFREI